MDDSSTSKASLMMKHTKVKLRNLLLKENATNYRDIRIKFNFQQEMQSI